MEYVKICGLKKHEHVQLCINNGADAIGFIYNVPTSPRNMLKHEIKDLLEQIKNKILTVIVLKPSNLVELEKTMNDFNPSYFQIHCDFNLQELKKLDLKERRKLIVALKVNHENKESIIRLIEQNHDQFFAFLIDNSEGHGNVLNIDFLGDVLKKTSGTNLIVAGGITIENIENIMKVLKPFGIDVSSSLESEKGVKDSSKIIEFLNKVREIRKKMRMN
ncbi:MAG: phosphoribosylanthranilate isomerase [Promethearchaeota archaeon]